MTTIINTHGTFFFQVNYKIGQKSFNNNTVQSVFQQSSDLRYYILIWNSSTYRYLLLLIETYFWYTVYNVFLSNSVTKALGWWFCFRGIQCVCLYTSYFVILYYISRNKGGVDVICKFGLVKNKTSIKLLVWDFKYFFFLVSDF